jgi:hypothetical protein
VVVAVDLDTLLLRVLSQVQAALVSFIFVSQTVLPHSSQVV